MSGRQAGRNVVLSLTQRYSAGNVHNGAELASPSLDVTSLPLNRSLARAKPEVVRGNDVHACPCDFVPPPSF